MFGFAVVEWLLRALKVIKMRLLVDASICGYQSDGNSLTLNFVL